MNTYTVKPGDSLSIIARDILGNLERWPEIATLNNISNVDLIHPGQELLLPGAPEESASPETKKKRTAWIIAAVLIAVVIIAAIAYYKSKH